MASRRHEKRKALRRQCANKIKHETLESAQHHQSAMFFRHGEKMHVYRCGVCSFYHVGHHSRSLT